MPEWNINTLHRHSTQPSYMGSTFSDGVLRYGAGATETIPSSIYHIYIYICVSSHHLYNMQQNRKTVCSPIFPFEWIVGHTHIKMCVCVLKRANYLHRKFECERRTVKYTAWLYTAFVIIAPRSSLVKKQHPSSIYIVGWSLFIFQHQRFFCPPFDVYHRRVGGISSGDDSYHLVYIFTSLSSSSLYLTVTWWLNWPVRTFYWQYPIKCEIWSFCNARKHVQPRSCTPVGGRFLGGGWAFFLYSHICLYTFPFTCNKLYILYTYVLYILTPVHLNTNN